MIETTNPWGFTNEGETFQAVNQFREAAVADGWAIEPTYPRHEDETRAATLTREGFRMLILARTYHDRGPRRWRYEACVSIWGPDGLTIQPPAIYDMAGIRAGVTTCHRCGATGISTHRVGFAGRACAVCLPDARAQVERPGWAN